MTTSQRRTQVDDAIATYRMLAERLRDVPFQAARQEREALEHKLVALRAERRALDVRRYPRRDA